MRFRTILLVLIGILVSLPLARPAETLQSLDNYYSQTLREWQDIPGMAVAVVRNDSVVFAKGYGTCTVGTDHPVNPHTRFAVASNSKAFTAALLGMLVSENKLRWDDRVIDYLPEFRMHDPYVTRDIRIRDLLTHRSGLPTYGGDMLWIGGGFDSDEIVRRIRFLEPVAPFRAEYHYNNLMFLTAGEIIEAVTGQSWEQVVRQRILDPLGMSETTTSIRQLRTLENVATPHEKLGGKITRVEYDSVDAVAAAAGLNSSVLDMSKWMRLNMNEGEFRGRQIIDPAILREMQSVQTPLEPGRLSRENLGMNFAGYGFGWHVSEYHGYKMVGHSGGLTGMISRQLFIPEKNIGVVVLTNFAPNSMTRAICYRTLDALLGFQEEDWSQIYLDRREANQKEKMQKQKRLRENRITGTTSAVPLEEFTGTYHEDLSGDVEIRMEEDHLVFDLYHRFVGDLQHWHYNTFRVTWRFPIFDMPDETFLTFSLNEEGAVEKFKVRFYHPHTFTRE